MSNLQIRNVPEDLHRKLKARAAHMGISLSEYLLREITELASRPTIEEFIEQLERHPKVHLSSNVADIIREERDAR